MASARSGSSSRSSRRARPTSSSVSARWSRCTWPPPIRKRSTRPDSIPTSCGARKRSSPTRPRRRGNLRMSSRRSSNQGSRPSTRRFACSISPLSTSRTRAWPRRPRKPKARPAPRSRSRASCATPWAKASRKRTRTSPPRWRQRPDRADAARLRRGAGGASAGRSKRILSERMMASPIYRRVVVKVSGEDLMGPDAFGIHQPTLERIAADLVAAQALGASVGIVVGGGNIFRGDKVSEQGVPRVTSDMMGILATVMNALALETAIERAGAPARTMSALAMPEVCETYERRSALRHLQSGRLVLFAAGTGNPFFTTDTTAVLRAAEIGADAVLKATDVDGVYSADPKTDNSAKRYDRLTHQEAIERRLKVMDATAFALAQENRMPIIVFSIRTKGAIEAVLKGQGRATIVSS